jgi:hypothetical protein
MATGMGPRCQVAGGAPLVQIALDTGKADGEAGGDDGLARPLRFDGMDDTSAEIITVCSTHAPSLAPSQSFRNPL